MTTLLWDPELYRRHDDHRARPFLDLIARVHPEAPRDVVDLGSGPGHLTRLLAELWPGARVHASDASREMVDAARAAGYRPRCSTSATGRRPRPPTSS